MLSLRCAALLIASLLAGCGDGTIADDTDTEPPPPGVGASTGVGVGPGAQACDATSFACPGFCNTQQKCGKGFCLTAPTGCSGECTGACGCDGLYYCNACVAHMSFVDVDADGACNLPPPTSFALALGPDPVRVLVLQYDPVDDICVQLMLTTAESEGSPFEATLPPSWSIESAIATDHALDCNFGFSCVLKTPTGEVAEAVGVLGSVEIDSAEFPNQVSAELTLTFDGAPWIDQRQLSLPLQGPQFCF